MKSVLITGATGFVGRCLVKQLLQRNCTVTALVRDIAKTQFPSTVRVFEADIIQPNSLKGVCAGIDTVFHLAGHAHAWKEKNKEAECKHQEVNYQGVKNILNEAIAAKVKGFIYFSTVKAVADSLTCIDEAFDALPTTPYGVAKRQAEQLVLAEGKKACMHVCVLRPTLVYGPGVKGNLMSMLNAVKKGYFPPLPEVPVYRSMIGLQDLCCAAILAAENEKANGKVYIVSDNQNYSTRKIYDLMCEALGRPIPKWQVSYLLLKLIAQLGDGIGRVTGKRFLFDSQTLSKLFGAAQYSSTAIRQDLGFTSQQTFAQVLPMMIQDAAKQ